MAFSKPVAKSLISTLSLGRYIPSSKTANQLLTLPNRGFAVIAPEKALASVQALGAEHSIRVEEDEVVSSL